MFTPAFETELISLKYLLTDKHCTTLIMSMFSIVKLVKSQFQHELHVKLANDSYNYSTLKTVELVHNGIYRSA